MSNLLRSKQASLFYFGDACQIPGIYEKLNKLVARFRERELQNGGRNNRNLDPSGSDNNRYEDTYITNLKFNI